MRLASIVALMFVVSVASAQAGAMGSMSSAVSAKINALNGSGESGSAWLTPMGAKTKVVIKLTGQPAKANQPAHIHAGTCAKNNPAPMWALKNVVGGTSTTILDAPIAKLTGGKYVINVHESMAMISKYVACGAIP